MPRLNFKYKTVKTDSKQVGDAWMFSISKEEYESFNSAALGLGDISQEGKYIQALAAFFDLEGFTSFSNQVDSHLVIPEFLQQFLDWLFASLAKEFKRDEANEESVILWSSLPFFTKFLGDGILFLWDTTETNVRNYIASVVSILYDVTSAYETDFLADIKKQVSKPPPKLRCGVARGQIVSVGNGEDYVGSCINIASRLQKLNRLTFAVSRRGFDMSHFMREHQEWRKFILKKIEMRGIGEEELIYIRKDEFERLPAKDKKLFKDP